MNRPYQLEAMVRENIRNLVPYASARDEFSGSASVFLDANENPFQAPLNRYPDPRQGELKLEIGKMLGQEAENIFLGNGSDEAIDLLFRVFCEPGRDHVITVDPTYGMYGVCADINAVGRKSVLLDPDFSLVVSRVLAELDENTRLIFLCSPNNPTSNSLDREAVLEIVRNASCLVVVDEAYADFSEGRSLLDQVPEQENLVVLRTFSKAWGLAGIRLGMAIAHPSVIQYMSVVKYPYNINRLTINRAMEALSDPGKTSEYVQVILGERKMLSAALQDFPFVTEVHPSDANFLLVRCVDAEKIYAFLMDRGIIVRDRSKVPLCQGCLRITVGSPEENRKLLAALKIYEHQAESL